MNKKYYIFFIIPFLIFFVIYFFYLTREKPQALCKQAEQTLQNVHIEKSGNNTIVTWMADKKFDINELRYQNTRAKNEFGGLGAETQYSPDSGQYTYTVTLQQATLPAGEYTLQACHYNYSDKTYSLASMLANITLP